MNTNTPRTSVIALTLLTVLILSPLSSASTYIWKKNTDSYRIYMEVVPAELVQTQPRLWDKDKNLHQVDVGGASGLSHVLVWVYRKPGNSKAVDVTVIAEVDSEQGGKVEKPLEKMRQLPGVVYGNIFRVHQAQEHTMRLKVYSPNAPGFEEAVFRHVGY